ncbi:MAG: NFACT RNA binding domain-containing protein [Candidatus Krumholzibacteriia bacterium]
MAGLDRQPSGPDELGAALAEVSRLAAGRRIHRAEAGPGWVRLMLSGEDRLSIVLSAIPGANVFFACAGPLPAPVARGLERLKDQPPSRLLPDAELTACGSLPDDKVAWFSFTLPDGSPLTMLHQLFGARGNLVLLDRDARVIWALHRPPHPLLATLPPAGGTRPDRSGGDVPGPGFPPSAQAQLSWRLAADLGLRLASHLDRAVRTASRLVDNLGRDLAGAEQGESYRRRAEALAANLHHIRPGQDRLVTSDLRDGSELVIALDPALGAAANLNAWFKRAGKAEKGRQLIADRLAAARIELAGLETARAALADLQPASFAAEPDPVARLAGLQAWLDTHPHLAPAGAERSARRRGEADEPARPFRRYLIEDRWEVWVGRSNTENDELTHRASHLQDIWLHAQGAAGSHVILRTGGRPDLVPRRVLEKAAALAALHSKARHSSLAPVMWTERRYVRRPRKSPPGMAVCLRDQTLMVAPGVGAGVVTI